MAQGRAAVFYWRIVPVGFGTAVLSALVLALVLALIAPPAAAPVDWLARRLVNSAALFGLGAVLVATAAWLPLMALWHLLLPPARNRLGLRRGAVLVSAAMALGITIGSVLLVFRGLRWGEVPLFGAWALISAGLAALLTGFAFRHASEAADP